MKKNAFSKMNLSKIRPELFFVTLASFFGLIILLITPPFQSPDEINHFYRAYQISEGNLIAKKQNNRVGGYLPTSLVKIADPFLGLRWDSQIKTTCKTITEQFKIPLNSKEKNFVDFPNTGMYSPISYLPQAIAILVLRKLDLPPLYIFYGARVFTLLFWIISIFYSIKIIPFYKWFFALVALLPMSVFINMSLSADVVTNLLSFILIAYGLKLAYSDRQVRKKQFVIISLLVVLLASAKLVYTPIMLLLLLIPKEKFFSTKTYYVQLISLFVIAFATIFFWSTIMNNLYVPYSVYDMEFRDTATLNSCADMHEQMQYILHHGLYLWHVYVNSMIGAFDMYFQGYIGTLGWLDTELPMPLIYLSYIVLCAVAFMDGCKNIYLKLHQKTIILFSFVILIGLVLLSQYLTWDCVGGDIIETLQGRYFTPIFPLLFMLFYNMKFSYPKVVVFLVVLFSSISLSFTIDKLYVRYYILPQYEEPIIIKCDAENITEKSFNTNTPSVLFKDANTQSNEKAKSGKFSVKLSPKNQFGFTYHLYNCGLGDVIHVDVWRYGTEGGIIMSGSKNEFYIGNATSVEKENAGWKHLELNFTLSMELKEKDVIIYLYNNGKDSSYFDDMVISYKKIK